MSRNFLSMNYNEKMKMNKKKYKLKKNAMDPVNFEEEKKNDPKYKTELCKTFMETNFCAYGNKCRFAHGYKELVVKKQINHYKQKLCNSFHKKGFCPYGNRCNFKHDERKIKEIGVPYYYSHLISLHLPQLKNSRRLTVFQDISLLKENSIKAETEKCNEQNDIKEEKEEENLKNKDELSHSFYSSKSSQASSEIDYSPIKGEESGDNDDDDELDSNKISDFFLKELNYELDIFSDEC